MTKYFAKWLQIEVEDILDEPDSDDNQTTFGGNYKSNFTKNIAVHMNRLIKDFDKGLDEDGEDTTSIATAGSPFDAASELREDEETKSPDNLVLSSRGSDQMLSKGSNESAQRPES